MAARNSPSAGSKPDKIWRDAVHRAVKRADEGEQTPRLERLADQLIKEALAGDLVALKEIGDRLDGKPAQAIVGGDEDSEPVRFVIQWPVKSRLYPHMNAESSSETSTSAPSDSPVVSPTDEPGKQ